MPSLLNYNTLHFQPEQCCKSQLFPLQRSQFFNSNLPSTVISGSPILAGIMAHMILLKETKIKFKKLNKITCLN